MPCISHDVLSCVYHLILNDSLQATSLWLNTSCISHLLMKTLLLDFTIALLMVYVSRLSAAPKHPSTRYEKFKSS